MPLGMEVGLGPGDFALDGDPAPPLPKRWAEPPKFSTHVYCGQTAGWMKLVLGMEVGLSPGDFVLDADPGDFVFDGNPAPLPKKGKEPLHNFRPMSIAAKRLHGSRCHSARS